MQEGEAKACTTSTLPLQPPTLVCRSVDLWDVRFRRLIVSFQGSYGHLMAVTDVSYAPSGTLLASASEDATVRGRGGGGHDGETEGGGMVGESGGRQEGRQLPRDSGRHFIRSCLSWHVHHMMQR